MSPGIWSTLDRLASGQRPAAVLAEWKCLANGEFAMLEGFLRATQRLAGDYPCLSEPDCGCRHELDPCDDTRWVARCQCGLGDCPPAWLTPSDLIIHELDAVGFGGKVARTLGFGPPESGAVLYAAPKVWQVGTYAATRSPVYLGIFPSEAELFANIEGLVSSRPEPFILLVPTAGLRSAAVDAYLGRVHCGFVPLAPCVQGDGRGGFQVGSPIEPVLKRFVADLAQARNMAPVLEGIFREVAAVRDDRRNLSAGNARLKQMHGEGMFAFAKHIDREARAQFLAIMAGGDVAKAARDLGVKDSTLRSQLAKWPRRGKAYAALEEIVRWRKAIRGQAGMEFAKRVASGAERDVDFPSLIRDVVAELEELTPENWEEQCADLAEALRKAVS